MVTAKARGSPSNGLQGMVLGKTYKPPVTSKFLKPDEFKTGLETKVK